MKANEALSKIAELLGLRFKSEKFFVTKLIDGETEITNGSDDAFEVGDELFVVEENILKPAPSGTHETREGLLVTVGEDSIISAIEKKLEEETDSSISDASTEIEVNEEAMSSATLADGTKIETDGEGKFEVGQKLYVVKEDGERVSAPEGEHTTESGIVVTVDAEGTITGVKYPDEEGSGSMENEMKKIREGMKSILSVVAELNKELAAVKKDYEEFKKSPAYVPGKKQSFSKNSPMDAKYEFLQSALKLNKK